MQVMIDIPLNKALVPIEIKYPFDEPEYCFGCFFRENCKGNLACSTAYRNDGKNVIFKLVDYKNFNK